MAAQAWTSRVEYHDTLYNITQATLAMQCALASYVGDPQQNSIDLQHAYREGVHPKTQGISPMCGLDFPYICSLSSPPSPPDIVPRLPTGGPSWSHSDGRAACATRTGERGIVSGEDAHMADASSGQDGPAGYYPGFARLLLSRYDSVHSARRT